MKMGFTPKGSSSGRHALPRQQPTGKAARSGAGKGKNILSKNSGRHVKGGKSSGDTKGGAAGGLDRWG